MNSGGPLEESCRVILCVCVCVSSNPPKMQPHLVTSRVFILSTSFNCCSWLCFPRCVLHSTWTLTVDLRWGEESLGLFAFKLLLSTAVLSSGHLSFFFCRCCFHRWKSRMCWLWHQRTYTARGKSNWSQDPTVKSVLVRVTGKRLNSWNRWAQKILQTPSQYPGEPCPPFCWVLTYSAFSVMLAVQALSILSFEGHAGSNR